MKKKLSLNELKVKSFVTSVSKREKIKSGVNTNQYCAGSNLICQNTEDPVQCPPTQEPPRVTQDCIPKTLSCQSEGGLGSSPPAMCAY